MDDPNPQLNLEPAVQPAPAGAAELSPTEHLHKQIRELQAQLEDHKMRVDQQAAGLWDEHDYLKKLFIAAILVLIIFNLGVLPFFVKQMRMIRNQLPNQRAVAFQMSVNISKTEAPLRAFAAQLQTFAAANPDYRPILDRYRGRLPQYFTTVGPALPAANPNAPEPAEK